MIHFEQPRICKQFRSRLIQDIYLFHIAHVSLSFCRSHQRFHLGQYSKRSLPLKLSYTPNLSPLSYNFLQPFPLIFQLIYQSQKGQKYIFYTIFVCWKFLCIHRNFCNFFWVFCSISSKLLLAVFLQDSDRSEGICCSTTPRRHPKHPCLVWVTFLLFFLSYF